VIVRPLKYGAVQLNTAVLLTTDVVGVLIVAGTDAHIILTTELD